MSTALTRRCTSGVSERSSFEKIELMCFSTARSERTIDLAMAALFLPCAISPSVSASRGVRRETGDSRPAHAGAHELVDDLRVDDRAALRDLLERVEELLELGHPLLEQVAAPLRPLLEQGERVRRLGVLAEHDHADVGVRLAQRVGGADALVGARRRHADVGEHDVGRLLGDRLQQRVVVLAHREHLEPALLEEAAHRLPHEVVVLGDDHLQGHGSGQ